MANYLCKFFSPTT